jgi:hypothetical protein
MNIRHAIAAAGAIALAACVTAPPPYAPSASPQVAGYSETQIESNRFFVTYRAPGGAAAALLQDYALLRAADLALQNGSDWFWVDRRTLNEDAGRGGGPSIGVGIGAGSWGGRTGGSVGVGINFPIGGQSRQTARAATVEIRFGEGAKPDDPNAYDAHSTAASLRARLAAPR